MHFIPDELDEAYMALRMKLSNATSPLSWTQKIQICMPKAKLARPALPREIDAAEESVGVQFPRELRELLLETNGVDGLYSSPICPLSRIVEINREYRTAEHLEDRMPFDHLLFFGDTGNGDDFAFPIFRSGTVGATVFMWEHETDCRQEYANELSDFLVHYAVQFYALAEKMR